MSAFSDVIKKIELSIDILRKAEGKLDEKDVAFRSKRGDEVIRTNAYRQIRRFYDYRLGALNRPQAHKSKEYQAKKRKLGLKADFWTLVFEGILYRTLRYEVRDGALYVVFDDARGDAVKSLYRISFREELLHPTVDEAKEMSKEYFSSVIQKVLEVWQSKR